MNFSKGKKLVFGNPPDAGPNPQKQQKKPSIKERPQTFKLFVGETVRHFIPNVYTIILKEK